MIYDIIVVGAGPAGLTAGANAANRGLRTLILEGQKNPGGQPAQFYPKKLIIDHPGFPRGVTGMQLSRRLYDQALHSTAKIRMNEPMVSLALKGKIKTVRTRKSIYKGRRVILCTGLHNIPRHLQRLKDYKGNNVYYYIKEPKRFYKKNILIIGDGDSAFDRACMLADKAKVTVVARTKMPVAKAKTVKTALERGATVLYRTELIKYEGKTATLIKGTKKWKVPADAVIVSIGFIVNLDVLEKAGLKKDEHGIAVNDHMETSIQGVFAAGDLVRDVKLIAVACSEGIIAAISTFNSIKRPYWLK